MAPLVDVRLTVVLAGLPVSFILIVALRRFIENRQNRPSLPPGPVSLLENMSTIDAKEPSLTYTEWRAASMPTTLQSFIIGSYDGSLRLLDLTSGAQMGE
ncbi:hypothetical protein BDR03DRAFT_295201 [Suillus americanus]|nr:hypothetical protein BDR03DRAFT_295201 [Suillus americanus]